MNMNLIENYYKPLTNVSLLEKPIYLDANEEDKCCYITMYEYGYKSKDNSLNMNIWINFMTSDGLPIFDQDIKVLNDSKLNINSQLIDLKMLNK